MLDQPMTSKMIAEKEGPIGRLIFNNPARHNAVSLEMWEAVTRIMDDFEQDDAIRVIVVSGRGAAPLSRAPTSRNSRRSAPPRRRLRRTARFPRARANASRIRPSLRSR